MDAAQPKASDGDASRTRQVMEFMRITHGLFIVAAFASTLHAQRPRALRPPPPASGDSPILQTVTFDVAAAFQQRYRVSTEALVFGRFSVGLSGEYTTQSNDQSVYYPPPVAACPIQQLCASDGFSEDGPKYRAWSFNLHGRWYPRQLSFDGERQSASIYIGEFIGYHERHVTQTLYYGYVCPACGIPPRSDSAVYFPPDSGRFYPPYPYPGGTSFTQILHGWEPGAEFGVRVLPARHVVIDVGGTLRIETLMDPQSGTRPGGLVKQLMVAVGVGW